LNEENNIKDCLASVAWSNDVVLLDSGSKDKTLAIARAKGARIYHHPFENFASQQNWALQKVKFRNPWVFYLDADERMTPGLQEEICRIAADPSVKEVGFFCGRKNFLWEKWIKHCFPPSLIFRFFKPSRVRFKAAGHGPAPLIDGPHGYLKNYFDHYNFSKGIEEWVEKHNRYSTLEALEGMRQLKEGGDLGGFFSRDPFHRRKSMKALSLRVPFRLPLKFIYLYFLKRGFLDGWQGLTYCLLQAFYEYMIVLKMKEFQLKAEGKKI
jgi:glycosyltransferase involved in cell wall biosynthesis